MKMNWFIKPGIKKLGRCRAVSRLAYFCSIRLMKMIFNLPFSAIRIVLLLLLATSSLAGLAQEKRLVIIDADTDNEVDDPFAIVRTLLDPSIEVLALNAAHWQTSQWAVAQSMEESYKLNLMILRSLKLYPKIKSLRGSERRMFDWGDKAQYSAATHNIIKEAQALPGETKLNILVLGALTNVASAILIEPAISGKLSVYWLGTFYDFDKGFMKKTDFNSVMDIQAVDVLLNSNVDMHIMPTNISQPVKFNFDETNAQIGTDHPLSDFLITRWKSHDPARLDRSIWDLAIVAVFLDPALGEEVKVRTSKENGDREIGVYKSLNAQAIKEDFFRAYRTLLKPGKE